jgi:hypothetical protein
MKNDFIANGECQLFRGQEKLSMEAIEKKYAAELAVADPSEKLKIREQIAREFLRQKNHKPSPGTLW